ncbi:hypothetical protein C3495_11670 [Clostridiaceae bacterium 14S0207]|nr:hypothetical protein C3495_11670 [Clostridiaceae bacterium 14S0207]
MYDFSKCFCGCEYTCKWVTCVFNNRCVKGKFIEMCGDFLVLRDKCGKCYYVNPEKILYMVADCPKPSCNPCC